ncbi:hypothetical protein PILCRDRAFT_792336 [Piloderma croceum F 1598]|uniref:Uncharacterized protein n=1 Tax=Piloderma croceum (strain F 1598) TaxID=765440 RepID=A0A0C3F365_PILCF|nr:hypothetical protein PILCRDRAFT_792336 [Piloderma croceum F 1598]
MAFAYHLITLLLFTKSDIKSTVIPLSIFSLVAAPDYSSSRIPHVIVWIWLHLLQFDVSNQTLQPDEDKQNKPWRPLPSGRITLSHAVMLRWWLVPLCWAVSFYYSATVLGASVAFAALTVLYNEQHMHSHWLMRGLLNAIGFASFEVGGTLIAGSQPSNLDSNAILAICLSVGIFLTTAHAQDFKDVLGDDLIGRKTLPIVYPVFSRLSMPIALMFWSTALSFTWHTDRATSLIFLCFSTVVGGRFVTMKTILDDQVSYYFYNAWLAAAYILPGYWRLYHAPGL